MAKVRVLCITFILSLIQSVCFAAVDPSKTGTFDKMQEVFMTYGVDGTFNLQNQALYLIGVFAVISLCTTWVLYTGEWQLQQMVGVIIKTSFFIMLALCWSDILNMIFSGFRTAGLVAAGESADAKVWTASGIISMGDKTTGALYDAIFNTSSNASGVEALKNAISNLPTMLMGLVAWFVIKACFFWMAFSLVLVNIEFAMFTCITMLMMPFGMLRWTETYFNKAVNGVFHFGVKMMVLYFILGMLKANAETFTWLGAEAQAIGSNISYGDVFNQMALIFLTALLVWLLPELAAGLLDGTPNMSAGSAVAGAGRAAGLGRTGYNLGKGVVNGIKDIRQGINKVKTSTRNRNERRRISAPDGWGPMI